MASSAIHAHAQDAIHPPAPPAAAPSPPAATIPPRPAPLTGAQIAIIKATVPVLQAHGATITELFYKNMLGAHPALRNIFNLNAQASGQQPRALAAAVLAYAAHIDDLGALRHAVERIAHKHVSLGVQPAQYAIVGENLLAAIGAVLGDAATPEIVDAWGAAYAALADVFVRREGDLYRDNGRWTSWRKFRIARREVEAEGVVSLYLAPVDGAVLPGYRPGQYVSVQIDMGPELGIKQSRQYSLSMAPRVQGDYYRISVKREEDAVGAATRSISRMLFDDFAVGDEVEVTHPQGEYFADPMDKSKEGAPLVLISAGIGTTPNLAILESFAAAAVQRPISWIHGSHCKASHPFARAVRSLQEKSAGRVSSRIFLSSVNAEDKAGEDFNFGTMRTDLSKLDKVQDLFIENAAAEYYICGPESFMVDMRQALEKMGVSRDRISLELFATGDVA